MHSKPSSHKARHIEHSHPLPKYSACARCKARKVRCSGASPACDACMRSAKFNNEDPSLVRCSYGGKAACGPVKSGSSTSKTVKDRSASRSPRLSRTASPSTESEGEAHENEARIDEMDQIIKANLSALPQQQTRSVSTDSYTSDASFWDDFPSTSASTSTAFPMPPANTFPLPLPLFQPDIAAYTALASDTPASFQDFWRETNEMSSQNFATASPFATVEDFPLWPTAAPAPSSPSSLYSLASFESSSSSGDYTLGEQTFVSPPDPPIELPADLPPNFSNAAHVSDTLSLPLFPLSSPSIHYGSQALDATTNFGEAGFWNSEWLAEQKTIPQMGFEGVPSWASGIAA